MDVSVNLGNYPHFIINDAGVGIIIWVMKNPKNENEDLSFILPNCSVNGSKGVAVKLHHGIMIEWDGLVLKHCTTHPGSVSDNTLFGLFLETKKEQL